MMKASELVKEIQEKVLQWGDLEVLIGFLGQDKPVGVSVRSWVKGNEESPPHLLVETEFSWSAK